MKYYKDLTLDKYIILVPTLWPIQRIDWLRVVVGLIVGALVREFKFNL